MPPKVPFMYTHQKVKNDPRSIALIKFLRAGFLSKSLTSLLRICSNTCRAALVQTSKIQVRAAVTTPGLMICFGFHLFSLNDPRSSGAMRIRPSSTRCKPAEVERFAIFYFACRGSRSEIKGTKAKKRAERSGMLLNHEPDKSTPSRQCQANGRLHWPCSKSRHQVTLHPSWHMT